jgi:hypothetical protein
LFGAAVVVLSESDKRRRLPFVLRIAVHMSRAEPPKRSGGKVGEKNEGSRIQAAE